MGRANGTSPQKLMPKMTVCDVRVSSLCDLRKVILFVCFVCLFVLNRRGRKPGEEGEYNFYFKRKVNRI